MSKDIPEYDPRLYSPRTRDVAIRVIRLPAGTWTPVENFRPSYLRLINSTANVLVSPENVPTSDAYAQTYEGGVAYLGAIGKYWIKSLDSTDREAILFDGGSQGAPGILEPGLDIVNINQIGGTAQSGVDVAIAYRSVTWANPTSVAVGTTAVLVAAADSARRAIALYNASATQKIAVSTNSAMTFPNGVIVLGPATGYVWDPIDAPTKQALYAVADLAGATLVVATGT